MSNKIDTRLSTPVAVAPDALASIQHKAQVKESHRKQNKPTAAAERLFCLVLPPANMMHKKTPPPHYQTACELSFSTRNFLFSLLTCHTVQSTVNILAFCLATLRGNKSSPEHKGITFRWMIVMQFLNCAHDISSKKRLF